MAKWMKISVLWLPSSPTRALGHLRHRLAYTVTALSSLQAADTHLSSLPCSPPSISVPSLMCPWLFCETQSNFYLLIPCLRIPRSTLQQFFSLFCCFLLPSKAPSSQNPSLKYMTLPISLLVAYQLARKKYLHHDLPSHMPAVGLSASQTRLKTCACCR